jgi:hypothetical protein
MGEDSRLPPLSRRVPGATNWPNPPVRSTPPVLPDHVLERLRAGRKPAREAPTGPPDAEAEVARPERSAPPHRRTGTANGLRPNARQERDHEASEPRPVRVLWQAASDYALSPEVDVDDTTEPIPVISAAADIAIVTVAPASADVQPDFESTEALPRQTAAQAQTVTALAPRPALLPRRDPGSHGPQPSPGRTRQVTARRPLRSRPAPPRPVPPRPALPPPVPSRPVPSGEVPPGAVPSAADAEYTTEPIPVIPAAAASGPAGPALEEVAVGPGPPAQAASAAAIPADLARPRTGLMRPRVPRSRLPRNRLGGVPAAPVLPGQTMLRPLFAEAGTLEEMLASVRAQAGDQSVRARRLRVIAIGLAVTVIVIVLAVVLGL